MNEVSEGFARTTAATPAAETPGQRVRSREASRPPPCLARACSPLSVTLLQPLRLSLRRSVQRAATCSSAREVSRPFQ